MPSDKLDFERALNNPEDAFGTPDDVLADKRLGRAEKRALLERWIRLERAKANTVGAHMHIARGHMLESLRNALSRLSSGAANGNRRRRLVRGFMQQFDSTVHPDHDLHEAASRMRHSGTTMLPVVDGDEVIGVITARDIYGHAAALRHREPAPRVRDRMSSEIAFCYDDDDLETALAVMERTGHNRVLVMDKDDYLSGLLTLGAIIRAGARRGPLRGAQRADSGRPHETHSAGARRADEPGRPGLYRIRPTLKV